MPKVSVIVPNYNHASFLPARLDSINAQTYRDFELIFLDDASGDDSLAVLSRYQRGGIRAYLNTRNSGGPFRQWNKGIRLARGEYIWLAESDDCCEADFLETLVRLLDVYGQAGLAYANSQLIDVSGKQIDRVDSWFRPFHPTRWLKDHVAPGSHECRKYLVRCNTIPNASAVLFRKALYQQIGGADETMALCGDWSTWVKLLLISDAAYTARPLNHFRLAHPQSVRHRTAHHPLCLEEHLTIVRLIQESVGLAPEARDQTLVVCMETMRRICVQEAGVHGDRLLAAARKVGSDFYCGLRDALMGSTARDTGVTVGEHTKKRSLVA